MADSCPGFLSLYNPLESLVPNDNLLNGLLVPIPTTIF